MRPLRVLVLALVTLGCSDVSDLPDAKPDQTFDAPGGPTTDARTVDASGGADAPMIDAAVDAMPDAP
jgi:hypothetical protein